VSLAAETFARRWTPLIVRELLAGSTRFNDLRRGIPNITASVLSRPWMSSQSPASSSGVRTRTGCGTA
jgi:hypothetical protein